MKLKGNGRFTKATKKLSQKFTRINYFNVKIKKSEIRKEMKNKYNCTCYIVQLLDDVYIAVISKKDLWKSKNGIYKRLFENEVKNGK